MKRILALLFAAAGLLAAADATGTWTGSLIRDDGDTGPAHLILKQEGAKLTGTGGPTADEQHPIVNGKAENGKLTFDIETPGGVMKFTLTQEGDAIKGDVARDHDGAKQTGKLEVKRSNGA